MVIMIRDEISKMPKGYWRKKYKKELMAKFGHLIGAGSGAKLGHGEDDQDQDDDDV
jgi:hypothetical protein